MKKFKLMLLILILLLPISIVKADDPNDKNILIDDIVVTGDDSIGSTPLNGFVEQENNIYYYLDGVMQKGIVEIDGENYLFGVNSGKLYKNGLATTPDGNIYYTNSEGIVQTGWQTIDSNKYYFDQNGIMQKGIVEIGENKFLLGVMSGKLYINGFAKTPDGNTYYTNSEGIVQTGWQTIDSNKYYFDDNGKLISYLKKNNVDTFYYTSNGDILKGIQLIDGNKYLFGVISGKLYTNGLATTPDGNTYYTSDEGIVQTGWQTIDSNKYYFDENGVMQKGVVRIEENKYLFGVNSGKLYTNGLATTPDGNTYYTSDEGIVQTGWQTIDSNKYYFDENGVMQKGVIEIEKNKYLFGVNSGKLYTNGFAKTPDGNIYYTNSAGIVQTGDLEIEGRWYRFNSDGILQSGWQIINGNKYYYNLDGSVVTGVAKIAGIRYLFSSSGVLLNSNVKSYIDVSYAQGQIDWDTLWSSGEIDGVILRIGFGSVFNQLDTWFQYNLAAVKRLNIPYTVYLYSYAENTTEAIWEVDNLVKWINTYGVNITCGLPIYLDIEEFGANTSAIAKYSEVIPSFVLRMNSYGLGAKVYTYANIARALPSDIRNYVDWIALYNTDNTYEYSWNGWQYTSSGKISGVFTRADLSVFK